MGVDFIAIAFAATVSYMSTWPGYPTQESAAELTGQCAMGYQS